MEYKRGRVAITPCYEADTRAPADNRYRWERLHIGHLRTLMLGQLICKELEIPYHIRLDGVVRLQSVYNETLTGDRGFFLLDMMRCLNHFGIVADEIYQIMQELPSEEWLVERVGKDGARRALALLHTTGFTPEYYQAGLLDDSVVWHPSLMIRGREFVDDVYWDAMQRGNVHAHNEDALFAALDREKCELSTPMVLLDKGKMSKTAMNFIHWTAVEALPAEAVWRFLVATALRPEDPFAAMGERFEIGKMSAKPYVWRWSDWVRLARETGVAE